VGSFRESISKRGLIRTVLPRSHMGSPFASSVFSDFHFRQRTDKPLTSFASPRFEILSLMAQQRLHVAQVGSALVTLSRKASKACGCGGDGGGEVGDGPHGWEWLSPTVDAEGAGAAETEEGYETHARGRALGP
jgi:hypothetical protein